LDIYQDKFKKKIVISNDLYSFANLKLIIQDDSKFSLGFHKFTVITLKTRHNEK